MKHKHAELFESIANGVPADDFECRHFGWDPDIWFDAEDHLALIARDAKNWTIRRKPRTIRIGELEVPEPMRVAPSWGDTYWVSNTVAKAPTPMTWRGSSDELHWLKAGLCQSTEEGAAAQRRAMVLSVGGEP